MTTTLQLESFDITFATALPGVGHAAAPATYEDGYADGVAAADTAFKADQTALQASLVQAVETAAFGYHEARADIVAVVTPLLDEMLSVLLPELLAPALYAHLHDVVTDALRADFSGPIRLAVSPEHIDSVQMTLANLGAPSLEIVSDPDLSAHAAWMTADRSEISLDLDAALAAIRTHIETLHTMIDQPQEVSRHG